MQPPDGVGAGKIHGFH